MEHNDLTSIISVAHCVEQITEKAVLSILASDSPMEWIFVNRDNKPEVKEKVKSLVADDQRVRIVDGLEGMTFSAACNLGAKDAKGKFLLFLAPDSITPPDAISRLQGEAFKIKHHHVLGARIIGNKSGDMADGRYTILTPRSAFVKFSGLGSFFPDTQLDFSKKPLPKGITKVPAISSAFMFLPAKSFEVLEGFDEKYLTCAENMDLCLRIARLKGAAYFVPDIVVTRSGWEDHEGVELASKHKIQSLIHYFHENFNHEYPQPVLWALDLFIMAHTYITMVLMENSKR